MDSQSDRYHRRVYTTLQLALTNVSLPSMDYTAIRTWVPLISELGETYFV